MDGRSPGAVLASRHIPRKLPGDGLKSGKLRERLRFRMALVRLRTGIKNAPFMRSSIARAFCMASATCFGKAGRALSSRLSSLPEAVPRSSRQLVGTAGFNYGRTWRTWKAWMQSHLEEDEIARLPAKTISRDRPSFSRM